MDARREPGRGARPHESSRARVATKLGPIIGRPVGAGGRKEATRVGAPLLAKLALGRARRRKRRRGGPLCSAPRSVWRQSALRGIVLALAAALVLNQSPNCARNLNSARLNSRAGQWGRCRRAAIASSANWSSPFVVARRSAALPPIEPANRRPAHLAARRASSGRRRRAMNRSSRGKPARPSSGGGGKASD